MFRIRLSKFKQVIAVAVIPRIFVRDTKQIKNKLNNYTHDVYNFARKSTDSGSKDDEIEKQRQIIEKCFGETPQPTEVKDLKDESSEMEKEHRNIESSDVRFTGAEKYDIPNEPHEPSHATSGMQAEEATVQATTAKIAEETLDQRVETIDETPHVEASPQKNEGFNTTPKVLGHDIEFFADEKIQKIDLDDLAKRCVGAPIGNIDELLIKEMKNMSNNDIKPPTDMNLIKCHGVEKYYSGIFEHFSQQTKPQKIDDTPKEPLCLFDENRSVGDNEIKSERITPLHVDAVHLFALDEGSKDYKETCFFRDSSINLASEIEEPLLDVPETISPYESQAMPFYEYGNKEHVDLDHIDASKTMYITGTAIATKSVADIPIADDVLFRNEDKDEPRLVIERQEMDPVESEPILSPTARPILVENDLKGHDNPSGFGNLSREQLLQLLHFYKNSNVKKIEESHVFTTSTEIPPVAGINPSPNSSISGAQVTHPEMTSKENTENMEIPVNSAISANQNPGEYYNMVWNEHQESNLSQQKRVLTAENHIMQMFCTQLQEIQDEVPKESEDSVKVLEYPVLLRDPFSYILLEQETLKNTVKEAPKAKVVATKIGNVTDSIKNDATCTDDGVPLSQILKRIRDKNRLEFCRNLLMQNAKPETSKNFTCMAQIDSNKQKSSPRPCQPPPKPPKEKCPKPCPPPCPPKKDPCAKLIPFFLNTIIRFDDPFDVVPIKQPNSVYCYKSMLTDDVIERLRKLGETLRFVKVDRDTNYVNDTTCARDFEPWIPIPSWPAPKVEKKRPFVCPKEGCKPVPVPRGNPPKQRPCVGVPKKFFSQLTPANTPDIIFIHL